MSKGKKGMSNKPKETSRRWNQGSFPQPPAQPLPAAMEEVPTYVISIFEGVTLRMGMNREGTKVVIKFAEANAVIVPEPKAVEYLTMRLTEKRLRDVERKVFGAFAQLAKHLQEAQLQETKMIQPLQLKEPIDALGTVIGAICLADAGYPVSEVQQASRLGPDPFDTEEKRAECTRMLANIVAKIGKTPFTETLKSEGTPAAQADFEEMQRRAQRAPFPIGKKMHGIQRVVESIEFTDDGHTIIRGYRLGQGVQ